MPDVPVAFFLEDAAHEKFITKMVQKIAQDCGKTVDPRMFNARGGIPAALGSLMRFLDDLKRGVVQLSGRILVIGIDANTKGSNSRRKEIRAILAKKRVDVAPILAVPDPYIERWLMLQPAVLHDLWGGEVRLPPKNSKDRGRYKKALADAAAPVEPRFGGTEFGEEIAEALDVGAACGSSADFKAFVNDVRSVICND